ncbi:hypothetical protein SAMN05216227_10362 [Pseudorhodobacter antarcticus]|jgi:hypothetical protein|uniref:Uncharacterized protein n=1 Tax=Pseudorhodobacter antarcticus TaxID=1077947 RepID=A0A1H8KWL0_9RHOB|nr:hypothetical protein SAMN05216227_10362 [Pseudorhodobacter antarcticus]
MMMVKQALPSWVVACFMKEAMHLLQCGIAGLSVLLRSRIGHVEER